MFTSRPRRGPRRRDRRGAMIALVGLMIIITLVVGSIAVEVARVQLVNTQLRKVTDAASHAGSEALARTQDEGAAIAAAHAIAEMNSVLGDIHQLEDSDIRLGRSEYQSDGTWGFDATGYPPNAVQVFAEIRPDGLPTTLGRVAGIDAIPVEQLATAAHFTRDIVFVLDRSGSMAFDMSGVDWSYPPGGDYCNDPQPGSRWEAVDTATRVFLTELENTPQVEQVGIVTYATGGDWCGYWSPEVRTDHHLSVQYDGIRSSLDWIINHAIPGGTAIGSGIDRGRVVLTDPDDSRRFADKMIILLTDGLENAGRSSLDAADDCAAEDIVIHTITFSDGADIPRMQEVASRTGGKHFHAPDEETLIQIFQEIARGIPIVMIQ